MVFPSMVPKVSVMQSIDFPGYRSLYLDVDNSPYGSDLDPPLLGSPSLPLHARGFGPFSITCSHVSLAFSLHSAESSRAACHLTVYVSYLVLSFIRIGSV